MTTRADAELYWPLTGSITPTNGTGSPTFTRSTAARIFDNEGKAISVPSGAVRIGGARMVYNRTQSPQDFSVATWAKYGAGLTTPSANLIVSGASTTQQYIYEFNLPFSTTIGTQWLHSFRVQYVDIRYVQIVGNSTAFGSSARCNFDLVGGTYTATGCTATITAVSAGVWDIGVVLTATGTTKPGGALALVSSLSATWLPNYTGDGIKSLGVLRYTLQDVTGQSDQTASEFVSGDNGAGVTNLQYFTTNKDGSPISAEILKSVYLDNTARTNSLLHCRDMTNAAWVKTNITATKNQIGIDGLVNGCSLLECTSANGTVLQTITAAAVAASSGFQVKRHTGTGTIEITRDGGTTWTNITHTINSDTYTSCKIENTSVTNPSLGFRMATVGDKIIVDAGINHAGTKLTPFPIFTTTAAVTVNAETLTIPTTSNISNTIGTILATVKQDTWSSGGVVGSTTTGLFSSDTNSGVQAKDGTNTVSGVAGTPTGSQNIGMRWTGSFLQAFSGDEFGVVGSYDGNLNLTNIALMPGVAGYIKDVAIFQTYLSNAELLSIFGIRLNDIFNNDAAIAFFKANGFPTEYNDGLLAWLKSFYGVENTSWPLADLLARYLREYGTRLPESVLTEFILLEDGYKLLQENGFRLTLETSGTIPVATLGPYLLLETGDFILQEDNNKFLLEA